MDFINYARRNNRLLHVEINDRDETRYFRYTPDQLRRSITRYCAWYSTDVSKRINGEYNTTITLNNGVKFTITLM